MRVLYCFVLLGLLGLAQAQFNETCATSSCLNGGNCTSQTWNTNHGTVNIIDCQCGGNAFGSKCASCHWSELGNWSIVNFFKGFNTLIWVYVVVAYSISLGIVNLTLFIVHRTNYRPFNGTSLNHAIELMQAKDGDKDKKEGERSLLDDEANGKIDSATVGSNGSDEAVNTKAKIERLGQLRYNPVYFDTWTIAITIFLIGLCFYTVGTSTAPIFHSQLKMWPFVGRLTDYRQCGPMGWHIFTGLALMLAASMYMTADYYQLVEAHRDLKRYKDLKKKGAGGYDMEFFMDIPRAIMGKWSIIVITLILIVVRALLSSQENRSCCVRKFRANDRDFGFNIVLIVFAGIDILLRLWFFFGYMMSGFNFLGFKSGRDTLDNALIPTLNKQMTGSRRPMGGNWLLYLTYHAHWMIEAYILILLAMDLDKQLWEPILKGYACFLAVLLFLTYRTTVFYMRQRSYLRDADYEANKAEGEAAKIPEDQPAATDVASNSNSSCYAQRFAGNHYYMTPFGTNPIAMDGPEIFRWEAARNGYRSSFGPKKNKKTFNNLIFLQEE